MSHSQKQNRIILDKSSPALRTLNLTYLMLVAHLTHFQVLWAHFKAPQQISTLIFRPRQELWLAGWSCTLVGDWCGCFESRWETDSYLLTVNTYLTLWDWLIQRVWFTAHHGGPSEIYLELNQHLTDNGNFPGCIAIRLKDKTSFLYVTPFTLEETKAHWWTNGG